MSKVVLEITMSLDGYVAGPNVSSEIADGRKWFAPASLDI